MKTTQPIQLTKPATLLLLLLSTLLHQPSTASAQGTAFTYQGRFTDNPNSPGFTGSAEFQFSLWDSPNGGSLVSATNTVLTDVNNGLFTVPLDFGSGIFTGAERWLQVAVRTAFGPFTLLSPRQAIRPSPYAIHSGTVNAAGIAGTIGPSNIGAGSITGPMLAVGSVTASNLADGAVTSPKLATNTLTLAHLALEVLDRLLPSGTVVAFGGSNAPAGWLLCNGSIQNGSDPACSALFSAIGKTYGVGDGSPQSFNLPDLRGRAVLGAGAGPGLSNRTLAAKTGTETETITQVPAHTHLLTGSISSAGAHSHGIAAWLASGSTRMIDSAPGSTSASFNDSTDIAGAHTHSHTLAVQSTGIAGVPVNNLQPSIVLNFIIKL